MLIIEHHVVAVAVVVAIIIPCPCLGLISNSKVSLIYIFIGVDVMMGYPILTRRPGSSSWLFLLLLMLSTLTASGRSRRYTCLELRRGHAYCYRKQRHQKLIRYLFHRKRKLISSISTNVCSSTTLPVYSNQ